MLDSTKKPTLEHTASESEGKSSDLVSEQILQRVRLYAQRRILWLRKVWIEVGAQKGNGQGIHFEIDGYLKNMDLPVFELKWYESDTQVQTLTKEITQLENALKKDTKARISLLVKTFKLGSAEIDLLHTCFAFSLDPNLSRVFAYLHDHSSRGYVSESLIARLYGHGYCLPLSPIAPLKLWGLVTEIDSGRGEPARFEISPFIRNWLLGMDTLDEVLTGITRQQLVHPPLANWPVTAVVEWIQKMRKADASAKLRLFIAGAEASGRRSFAAAVANKLKMPLLSINSERISEARWDLVYMSAQRQAHLTQSSIVWYGNGAKENTWLTHFPSYPIQFMVGEVDEYLQAEEGFLDLRIELPPLQSDQRRELWMKMVPAAKTWEEEDLANLVHLRQTTVGQINAVAALGVNKVNEAFEAIGAGARRRLGNLAQLLSSDFNKADLVLSESLLKSLDNFMFEATERVAFWEQSSHKRLFPQGQGLLALFAGPPGTGKTMAAQVIANELKLDLYRVDLSSMVSKYVGETSKNIERILSRAQRMDAVLLFDEADALFGKRTEIKDAHDRFANTDTNYLLQAIEQYPGIAILASNKRSNIDQGFSRRLRYILEFPKPDVHLRLHIWQHILTELVGDKITNCQRTGGHWGTN